MDREYIGQMVCDMLPSREEQMTSQCIYYYYYYYSSYSYLTILWHFIYVSVHWLRHSLCGFRSTRIENVQIDAKRNTHTHTRYNIMMSSNDCQPIRDHSFFPLLLLLLSIVSTRTSIKIYSKPDQSFNRYVHRARHKLYAIKPFILAFILHCDRSIKIWSTTGIGILQMISCEFPIDSNSDSAFVFDSIICEWFPFISGVLFQSLHRNYCMSVSFSSYIFFLANSVSSIIVRNFCSNFGFHNSKI